MKRIHLFEFEDQAWFPNWIRVLMTRYIMAFHRLIGTADHFNSNSASTDCLGWCSLKHPYLYARGYGRPHQGVDN